LSFTGSFGGFNERIEKYRLLYFQGFFKMGWEIRSLYGNRPIISISYRAPIMNPTVTFLVRYLLKLPDQQRDSALECFNNYIEFCPGAQSVIGCIDINHHLDMEKKED
jgi:hypothetical protein